MEGLRGAGAHSRGPGPAGRLAESSQLAPPGPAAAAAGRQEQAQRQGQGQPTAASGQEQAQRQGQGQPAAAMAAAHPATHLLLGVGLVDHRLLRVNHKAGHLVRHHAIHQAAGSGSGMVGGHGWQGGEARMRRPAGAMRSCPGAAPAPAPTPCTALCVCTAAVRLPGCTLALTCSRRPRRFWPAPAPPRSTCGLRGGEGLQEQGLIRRGVDIAGGGPHRKHRLLVTRACDGCGQPGAAGRPRAQPAQAERSAA